MKRNNQKIAYSIKLYKECSKSFINLCQAKFKILMEIPLFFIAMYKSSTNIR
jgi:hypothetical protein